MVAEPPLALFDLDNTLFDRETAFRCWARQFCLDRGLPEAWVDRFVAWDADGHRPKRELFNDIRTAFGLAETEDQLIDAYHRLEYPKCYVRDEAVLRPLRRLRTAGFRIVIVTNGSAAQRQKIEMTGLSESISGYCISEVLGVSKPSLAIFEAAAAIAGCSLQGWMVGDSPEQDVGGGHAAGLDTIWLSRGRQWERTEFSPTYICDSVTDAIDAMLAAW